MNKPGSSLREGAPTRPSRAQKPRRYRRFPLDAGMAISRPGHSRSLRGRTLGISPAGISALLAADLEIGESVHLEFELPGFRPRLAVRAVVRNRSGARYGFEFLSLSCEQREAIGSFCDAQLE